MNMETKRWWIKTTLQPVIFLACFVLGIVLLGVVLRFGFGANAGGESHHLAAKDANMRYICPMMCTPPLAEPGRCPVCGMELVPLTSATGDNDPRAVHIDPVARRVANIQTVSVRSAPASRTIRAIGQLKFDEGKLKTISAYVDGRLERLYADYTGVVVAEGDELALVYSPKLYSGQEELLLAKKAREKTKSSTRLSTANNDIYEAARQRLIELGMTTEQIEQLEQSGEASSRLRLLAPMSGTVIEKLAVEGQYVKEGQAIYKLADLSTVWLMLEMYPEDAVAIRLDQEIQAEVQSLPSETFTGHVAFIDPQVNPTTRTVGVRVVIANADGRLRVGDYAQATINVPLASGDTLVVPRDAILRAGRNSVVYVETEPGRFEMRPVELGARSGDDVVVLSGVKADEQVATGGNFLIDSQMQLAGKPSLIDPMKAQPGELAVSSDKIATALAKLSDEDRVAAQQQRICPVTKQPLGSMGPPKKIVVDGEEVFVCCESCRTPLLEKAEDYLEEPVSNNGDRKQERQNN